MKAEQSLADQRVLILTPTQRDADVTAHILNNESIKTIICRDLKHVCDEIKIGADAAIITQEAIFSDKLGLLKKTLHEQPTWSDFPIIALTPGGQDSPALVEALQVIGHMTLLNRPLHITTLISTIRSLLRDRQRQYKLRDYLIDRQQIEDAIAFSEKRFRDMADSINQMIWVTRPDGFHEYYNKRWYDYTGVPAGSTDGEGWNGMFHAGDQERAWKRWQHSLNTGEPYEIEYRLRRADGVYRWTLGRAECVRDENGRITKWYGTCTDIQDLVDARQNAEKANIAKTEFLANMSHEIRTPMNAVIGLANILASSKPLTDRQKEFIETLQMSADSLLALINDLLDIAKIEAKSVELEEVPFSLAKMMKEISSMMSVQLKDKDMTFTYDLGNVKAKTYIGDQTRLRQILVNLCSNAVKFTERGSVSVTFKFKKFKTDLDTVYIAVKDTGIGIAPEKLQTIFEKFVQADSTINRKYGGTGLGLAITKTLSEIMGGSLTVASTLGEGSTFAINLPLKIASNQMVEINESSGEFVMDTKPANSLHILLVEDNPANILVASTFLEYFGYTFEVASSGLEAIDKIKANRYDAVLMDVQMHGMNGLEATRHIREIEKTARTNPVAIIGMTANALLGDREECIASGMDDYISKPFNPKELKKKIEAVSHSAVSF